MWDIDAVPKILDAGKQAVEKKKEEILEAVRSFGLNQQKTLLFDIFLY